MFSAANALDETDEHAKIPAKTVEPINFDLFCNTVCSFRYLEGNTPSRYPPTRFEKIAWFLEITNHKMIL